jgi:hypothetical protein
VQLSGCLTTLCGPLREPCALLLQVVDLGQEVQQLKHQRAEEQRLAGLREAELQHSLQQLKSDHHL